MAGALPRDAVVAVIGAGTMGAGIAQVAAVAGHPVLLFDARPGAADAARDKLASTLETLAAKGKLAPEAAGAAAARIVAVHALGDCAGGALVIEAIVEDLAVKRALFAELEGVVRDDALLATNTSSLSVTSLAAGLKHPARVVGLHFFNPAPVMPLVEIVSGLATDAGVAATLHATAAAWGKAPVHASSTPGFIVNRCARPFYGEAWRLLDERAASPATIDALLRDAGGFRMGPFELMDLIGHDVNLAVTGSVWQAYHYDTRFTPSVRQRELVDAGFHGRKTGRGLYDYREGAVRPAAEVEPSHPAPARVTLHGDLGIAAPLAQRLAAAGVSLERRPPAAAFPRGALSIDGAFVALTDGRTATARRRGRHRRHRRVRPGAGLRDMHATCRRAGGSLQRRRLGPRGGHAAGRGHRRRAARRRRRARGDAHGGHARQRSRGRRRAGHRHGARRRHGHAQGRQLSAGTARVGRRARRGRRPRDALEPRRALRRGPLSGVAPHRAARRQRTGAGVVTASPRTFRPHRNTHA